MSPTPPPSVVRDLAAKDSSLRLRWGPNTSLWYVEKKMDARHPQLEKERPCPGGTSPKWQDIWPGWRDGYAVVMAVHPSRCHSRLILEALKQIDFQQMGGTAALNRHLDEIQAAEDRAAERLLDNFVGAGSREIFDRDAWIGKRKVYVPNDEVTVERITPIEQHEGYAVRDRRVLA